MLKAWEKAGPRRRVGASEEKTGCGVRQEKLWAQALLQLGPTSGGLVGGKGMGEGKSSTSPSSTAAKASLGARAFINQTFKAFYKDNVP